MHILFLTDNFPPEFNAPASRTFEHCREWVRQGHQVTVITCAPNFPTGKVFEGYRNRLWSVEICDGIQVVRVWSFITANSGFALRILDYVSYAITATIASLFVKKTDIVVATSPQLFTAVAGFMSGFLKRKPFVFELRDLWPESIKAVSAMKQSRVIDLLEKLELFLYRKSAAIVSVTQAFRANLVARGVPNEKIFVVRNGANLDLFKPRSPPEELLKTYGLQGKFVVGYIGTLGMAHGLETLIDAAVILQNDEATSDIVLVFLGTGSEKAGLLKKAEELSLRNILFLDPVPRDQVADHWSMLKVTIIHLRKTPLFETVIPSKIFEAMAMGIPVVMGVRGEAAELLRETGAGVLFDPGNAAELAESIKMLRLDPLMLRSLGQQGIRAAAGVDRVQLANKMLEVLQGLRHTT